MGIIGVTDALYEPLVARQTLNSQHWSIQTMESDVLVQTADGRRHVSW